MRNARRGASLSWASLARAAVRRATVPFRATGAGSFESRPGGWGRVRGRLKRNTVARAQGDVEMNGVRVTLGV